MIIALLIILVVIVVGVIVFVVIRGRRGDLNATCDPSSSTCDTGLVCDSATSTCKAPASGVCTVLSDCVTGTIECRPSTGAASVCQTTATGVLGQSCSANVGPTSCIAGLVCDNATASASQTCRKPNGQPCTAATDCITGSTCANSICTPPSSLTVAIPAPSTWTPPAAWSAPPSRPTSDRIDLVQYGSRVFEVLTNGQIRDARTGRLHHTSRPVTRMVSFNGYLHALSNGRLYQLSSGVSEDDWSWESIDYAPDGLVFLSASHDGKTMWFQTVNEGFVVSRGSTRRENITPGTWRVYGNDERQWLELSTTTVTEPQSGRRIAVGSVQPYTGYALHDMDGGIAIADRPDRFLRLIEWEVVGF